MARNWAIAIGINGYSNLTALKYAKRDAEAMGEWFEENKKKTELDRVFLFTEDSPPIEDTNPPIATMPTYGNLRGFLRRQFERPLLKPGDNLWFFFAGHGRRYADKDYLMLSDSDPGDVTNLALSVDWITERLRRSGADNVVLFLDACRDENSRDGLGISTEEHQGVITYYSCKATQRSWEIDELQHGSFTAALLEGFKLQGEANCATVERLDRYLCRRVPEINRLHQKPAQTPYLKAEPPYKIHFVLLEKQATLQDAEPLKLKAALAEAKRDWQLARQLWIRVLAVSPIDSDAIEAIERLARISPATFELSGQVIADSPGSRSELNRFEFDVITVDARGRETKRERHQAPYLTEKIGDSFTLEMVEIPGGSFEMGSPEDEPERYDYESPRHRVSVASFFLSKYPITQIQWRFVASLPKIDCDLDPDPSAFKGDLLPVEKVSWYDAVEFCARLSRKTGFNYCLPSEAQWEYVCRAGTETPFHFGKTITSELANYDANYTYAQEEKGEYCGETTLVGSFSPNKYGLYDMHGNVWEWCADPWHENYAGAPTNGNVWDEKFANENHYQNYLESLSQFLKDERRRVIRGGSWFYDPGICRSAYRFRLDPDLRSGSFGFRVARFPPRT